MLMRRLKRFFNAQSGAAAVEAAIIFPFMGLVYFGLQDFTSLVTFNRKLNQTAATISDTIAQYQTTIARSDITDIYNAVSLIMQPTPAANVGVVTYGYYMNGSTVAIRWQTTNGSGPTCAAPDTSNFASLMTTASNDLVVTVSCMNYAPWVSSFLGPAILGSTTFLLSQTIVTRTRASQTLTCTTTSGGSTACTS